MRDRPDRVSYAVATTNDLAARIWSSSATQQSFAIADELAANPNSIRWKRDITINDVDSGDFDESSGALAIYEESLTLRRRLAEIDPRNNQWQRDNSHATLQPNSRQHAQGPKLTADCARNDR